MKLWNLLYISLVALILGSCNGQNQTDMHAYTNDLIHETSPYLLQHAHNPVDWKPWNEVLGVRCGEVFVRRILQ